MRQTLRLLLSCLAALLCLYTGASAYAEETQLLFPNGLAVAPSAASIDLSDLSHEDVDEALDLLGQMENLRHIDLGADRAVTRLEREGTPLPVPEQIWTDGYTVRVDVLARRWSPNA